MRIAIVDDNRQDRLILRNQVRLFFGQYELETELAEYGNAEEFISSLKTGSFDLVFMDIVMDGMDGMEAAKYLYRKDPACLLVFLTVCPDYAVLGYDIHAFQYLLKPVGRKKLWKLLEECRRRLASTGRQLQVKIDRQDMKIPFSRILYTMTAGRNTEIHLAKRVLTLSSHITFSRTIEPLLEDSRFVICSRGLVINMEHASLLLADSFLMDSGEKLPISRREYRRVRKEYLTFSFDEI